MWARCTVTDEERTRALLTMAAVPPGGPIDPPVASLVARGRTERRRRGAVAVSVAALATAVAIVVPIALVGNSSHGAVIGNPPQLSGPTAQQLAHGTWVPTAPAPWQLCGPVATWDGEGLIVVDPVQPASRRSTDCGIPSETGAGIYDPLANRWTTIASPPASLGAAIQVAWGGGRLLATSAVNGSAAFWTPSTNSWSAAPARPDPSYGVSSLTWTGVGMLVTTIGKSGAAHVEQLVGNSWRSLPSLPPFGESVADATTAVAGRQLYAITTTQPANVRFGSSFYAKVQSHLMRLDGDSWRSVSLLDSDEPVSMLSMSTVGHDLLLTGADCPVPVPCTLWDVSAALIEPGQGTTPYNATTSTDGSAIAVTGGGTAVVYQGLRTTQGTTVQLQPHTAGETEIFDLSTGRILHGPSAGAGPDSLGTFWTPDGVVCLGETPTGGLILRPAAH
jgi:hypothetical protein